MGSIRLSPKHGINPSMDTCPWCGQTRGVVLLGKLKNDEEAPTKLITSYDPCDTCQEQWNSCVICLEAQTTPVAENQPPITESNNKFIYPTYRHIGITQSAALRLGLPTELGRPVLIEKETFEKLFKTVLEKEN